MVFGRVKSRCVGRGWYLYPSGRHSLVLALDDHQENGFYLYVETGGCQLTGNRTRVYRGGNLVKDMNNIRLPFKLEDGDVIELGKSVNLLFKLNE